MNDPFVTLHYGDALTVLKAMPDESVDMVLTSPPYWGLRAYKTEGQIWPDGWQGELGLEPKFEMYIDHLIEIFAECKRVLKKTGTIWVNIADSYAGGGRGNSDTPKQASNTGSNQLAPMVKCDVPAKSLIGIPERLALAMTDRLGLIRRNTIIWYKRNPMPESVKDRFTEDFEYLYMFAKQGKYYFEQQFECQSDWSPKGYISYSKTAWVDDGDLTNGQGNRGKEHRNETGRNRRCVWDIPTQASKGTHYASYPEKLCRLPILAGCPAAICTKCGKARTVIYEKTGHINKREPAHAPKSAPTKVDSTGWGCTERPAGYSDCGCNADFYPGTVLDPFAGTGTTGAVAKRLGRKAVLIELSTKYCQIIEKRISLVTLPMELKI